MITLQKPALSNASLVILGVTAILFVALSHFSSLQIGDDSFIFFRYADNVLAGHGPVWNPGERVEGYSSPLWLALLAGGRALGVPYVVFARWVGWACVLGGVIAMWTTARRLRASDTFAAIACLMAMLVGTLHYWAPSGLETSIYILVFGWTCAAITGGRVVEWAVWTALLGLVRPEGLLMAPWSCACFAIAHGPRALKPRAVLGALAPTGAYLAWRLSYFHAPWPNTYYAKATGALGSRLWLGLDYGFWIGLVLAAACVWTISAKHERQRPMMGALAFAGALFAIAVGGGGDWMWGHRLIVPMILPLFAISAALVERIPRMSKRARVAVLVAVLFAGTSDDLPFPDRVGYVQYFGFDALGGAFSARGLERRFVRPFETIGRALIGQTMDPGNRMEGTLTEVSADVAAYLRATYGADALVAVNHAGAVPFHSRMPSLDMTGLTDAHIARDVTGGLHQKFDVAYVVAKKPRAVVLNSRTRPGEGGVWYHEGYWEGETALVRYEPFVREYRAVPRYWSWHYTDCPESFVLVYERIAP